MTRWLMRAAACACCVLLGMTTHRCAVAQDPAPPSVQSPQVAEPANAAAPGADESAPLAGAATETQPPLPSEELAEARHELRLRARELEESFGVGSPAEAAWKIYLKWENLVPQLSDDAPTDAASLEKLDEVLFRLRADEQGLEGEPFTNLAAAIERYRDLVPWAEAIETPIDAAAELRKELEGLEESRARDAETPTTETAREISKFLHYLEMWGFRPDLIASIRDRYAHPNVWLHISARMIARVPTEPVNTTEPVRDCILGTTICGEAQTCGKVTLRLCDGADHIALAATLVGQIYSRTTGYHKPVRIQSRSTTDFNAVKRADISDEAFVSRGASAHANTHTTILSIVKLGRQLMHKLVVKIAWKRALSQKPQAEAIASRHAERTIEARFDERLDAVLANARKNYEEKIRKPLIRFDLFPDAIGFSSTTAAARIAATFAKPDQLAAPGPPPGFSPANDVTVQVHESAINNAMRRLLGNVKISQHSAGMAPELSGSVANFLRKQLKQAWENETGVRSGPPWSMELDTEFPATLHFGDGKLILRMRTSHIQWGEREFSNWDVLGTYDALRDGDKVVLRRVGELDALPAGYDPGHPRPLNPEEASVRQELTGDMNARAVAGDVFPPEVRLPLVSFPDLGRLQLHEIILGGGWLSLGWVAQ